MSLRLASWTPSKFPASLQNSLQELLWLGIDLMYKASISENFDSMSYVTCIFSAQGEVLVLLKWMEHFNYFQWDQNFSCIWDFQTG